LGYVGGGQNGGVVTRLVLEPHGTTAGMIIVNGVAACPDRPRGLVRPPGLLEARGGIAPAERETAYDGHNAGLAEAS
jgi:hypothetical protein